MAFQPNRKRSITKTMVLPNKTKKMKHLWKANTGGAAIEYIIVSTFATLLAIATVTFVAKTVKSKIGELEQKLGVAFDEDFIDIFE